MLNANTSQVDFLFADNPKTYLLRLLIKIAVLCSKSISFTLTHNIRFTIHHSQSKLNVRNIKKRTISRVECDRLTERNFELSEQK